MNSHNMINTAQALVDLTKKYLMEIQSNEDWSLESNAYISKQVELVKEFQSVDINSLPSEVKMKVQDLMRLCYQLELQINSEVARQHQIVSNQIAKLRKGNNFKTKYEASPFGSGIMFDSYK